MYDRVLVGTDGSDAANRSVEAARTLADRTGAALYGVYVVDTEIGEGFGDEDFEAVLGNAERVGRNALAELAAEESTLEVHRDVVRGVVYEALLDHAAAEDVDLVVVGSRGEADVPLGSTAERVVALSSTPVLTVPEAETAGEDAPFSGLDDVVVPLDGSDTADLAAEHALDVAEYFDATLHALYVVDTTVYDLADAPRSIVGLLREGGEGTVGELVAQGEERGVRVKGSVTRGRPSKEILKRAASVDADLVVMGTRGRSGLPDRLLGSTTRRVVRSGRLPVLSLG